LPAEERAEQGGIALDIIDPNDLERIGNDLDQVARRYSNGAQELDQHVVTLEHTVAYLLSGGFQQWKGLSSEAFQGAWQERKARMQQASLLMILSAGHLRQFVRILEEQLPALRADQSIQSSSVFNTLSASAQSSIQNEESQAQNSILMAIVALNSQLEQLAEEISDCPQDDQTEPYAGFGDTLYKNETNDGGMTSDDGNIAPESGTDLPTDNLPDGWVHDDLGPDNQGVSFFENVDSEGNKVVVILDHKNNTLVIEWMDSLDQVKEQLPELVSWLGDRVQTVKGFITDGLLGHLEENTRGLAVISRMFRSLLTREGFDQGVITVDGNRIWITYKRMT